LIAALSPTTVLLIAAPVVLVVFLLVLVLYASKRARPAVAQRLERDAAKRERARMKAAEDIEALEAREPVTVGASHAGETVGESSSETTGALAVQERGLEVGPSPSVQQALEEATRARLVAPPVPVRDPEKAELDRRQFLNKGLVGGTALGLGIFGVASIAFLYPKLGSGFGGKVKGGKVEDALAYFKTNHSPLYVPEGRYYVVPFAVAPEHDADAKKIYSVTYEVSKQSGVTVIYQKCAHLGCRVPWCQPSQWFECPCHGSQYNQMGERQGGPAPRGLSRFKFSIENGEIVAQTNPPVDAPPTGINTPGLPPPSQHCVG
jgi:cytochrome b6-f complex iron-sulfur subunit